MTKSGLSTKPTNMKRRNNEKRKEKSRVAARCRRTKEMQIFAELTSAIPAKKDELEQLDKASVMRLAISYLRTRDVVFMLPGAPLQSLPEQLPKSVPEDVSSELSYMKALDGFVLVLSQQGDIVYCSENISEHLGVTQMEIMGQSVYDFSHPCDHEEIREALRSNEKGRRDLLLRLKCTLTSKGRNVHLKSASYKVIHVTGHMLTSADIDSTKASNNNKKDCKNKNAGETSADKINSKTYSLIAVGRPIPHPSNIETPLGTKTFLSKHSLDMKFTYADESLVNTLGFAPEDLIGQPFYEYHHAADSAELAQHFKSLFSKGQCETGHYRFLAKNGGYAWVQTQATVITDKQQKPVSIVCVNYVVSGIECKDEVFAAHQLHQVEVKSDPTAVPTTDCTPSEAPDGAVVAAVTEEERPIPATELIFAPRTKEMNKGFLMFSEDENGVTMLKDEPEDLTHLAPTAGDACIPLENSPFDMFDDFILADNYVSLLDHDLNASPVDSLLLSSPDPLETDSSCEPSSLLTEFSLENGHSDGEREKSPFIPASDDMPVIAPAVMWGALPDNVSLARPQPTEALSPAPALQRLLAGPPTGPLPQDIITNIYCYQETTPNKAVNSWETRSKRTLKLDDEPSAKRMRRSPSPAPAPTPAAQQSSSVLMNLLDDPLTKTSVPQIGTNFQQLSQNYIRGLFQNLNTANLAYKSPMMPFRYQTTHSNASSNPTSPLSLNIGSPMYSYPSSPNCSPAMSPAQRERLVSPYPKSQSPASLYSPANRVLSSGGLLQVGTDPYLNYKMQPSPLMVQKNEEPCDVDMLTPSGDFWMDSDLFLASNDLLSGLDDIKLV